MSYVNRSRADVNRSPRTLKVTTENSLFQQWLALRTNRSKRHRMGLFLVEGTTAIDAAVKYGWSIEDLLFPTGKPLSDWALAHLDSAKARRHVEVSEPLLRRLTDRHEGTELLAVVRQQVTPAEAMPLLEPWVVLALDRPKSPGNVGSIIRTAASFGAGAVVITGHAADPFDPACVRASVGALFAMPLLRFDSHQPLFGWITQQRSKGQLSVVATGHHASVYLHQVSLTDNVLVLLGNETHGLSRAYRELSDCFARLPTTDEHTSLNVAAAAAAALYEVRRQRLGSAAAP